MELTRGQGGAKVDSSLKFFDHMLATFARYAGLDIKLHARGDLPHHIMEDVAIAVGTAVYEVIPPTAARYGERTIPMDDALVQAVIDTCGRSYYRGPLPRSLYDHWMRSFCEHARS